MKHQHSPPPTSRQNKKAQNMTYWEDLGNRYLQSGDLGNAIEAYKKAIELDPNAAISWNNLGNAYFSSGDFANAIEAYKKAIELDPNAAICWSHLGNASFGSGDFANAIEAYKKAIELDPNVAVCWNNLGNASFGSGDFTNAIETYNKAIELDPCNAAYWSNLGNAYCKLGNVSFLLTNKLIASKPSTSLVYEMITHFYKVIKWDNSANERHTIIEKVILPLSKHLLDSTSNNNSDADYSKERLLSTLGDALKYYIENITHIERFGLSEQMSLCYAKASNYEKLFSNLSAKERSFSGKNASYHVAPALSNLQLSGSKAFQEEKFLAALISYDWLIGSKPWCLDYYVKAEIAAHKVADTPEHFQSTWQLRDGPVFYSSDSNDRLQQKAKEYHLKATTLLPIYARCLEKISEKFGLSDELKELLFSYIAPEGETWYTTHAPIAVLKEMKLITDSIIDVIGEADPM